MNLKKNNVNLLSSDTNFTINLVDYTNNLLTNDEIINAERLIDKYAKNRMPSMMSAASPYSIESFQADLQFLSRKMEAVRKTLSIWESYRIADVATNRDELEYKLGALAPNSGLAVNFAADNESIGDMSYSQGDVVFKDYLGNSYLLKSFSGGYYFPCKATPLNEAQTVLQIDYQYTTNLPIEDSKTLSANEVLQEPYTNINFKITETDTQDRYSLQQSLSPNSSVSLVALFNTNNELIRPVTAWYLLDANNNKIDRIYFDSDWEWDGNTTITFTNVTPFSCWCEVR